jgi:2'-5' RNA ligase
VSGPTSLRLFLAASLHEHLAWVGDRVAELQELWPEARWIPPQNQHVTLKFLGSTPESELGRVVSACERVAAAHRPQPIGLSQLGVFPSPRRARVLWIGLDDPAQVLTSLAQTVDEELASLGFPRESRPYSPHLTVARFKTPTVAGDLPVLRGQPGPCLLRSFDLWRSHLSPKGARYERLVSFSLA